MADIELLSVTLGLGPFELVQLKRDSDGSGAMAISLQYGGGVETPGDLMLWALADMPDSPLAKALREARAEVEAAHPDMTPVARAAMISSFAAIAQKLEVEL